MLKFLNAGFGSTIGSDLLGQLAAKGVTGIRQVVPATLEQFGPLLAELVAANMQPLWVVNLNQIAWLPAHSLASFRNEPDLYSGPAQAEYLRQLPLAFAAAKDAGVRLAAGPVSNLNDRGFAFLERMLPFIPPDAPIDIHRYPESSGPREAHNDYETRDGEVRRLRELIGTRTLWVSEVGFSSAEHNDDEIAAYLRYEFAFWLGAGAELCAIYQLNDAPYGAPASVEGHYGIRRPFPDGTWQWKPSSEVFR